MRECREKCGHHKVPRSIGYWAAEISADMGFPAIIEKLDTLIKEGLIFQNDRDGVQVDETYAYTFIADQLIETGMPVDDIAKALLLIRATDALYALIDYILERNELHELGLIRGFIFKDAKPLHREKRLLYAFALDKAISDFASRAKITTDVLAKVEEIW